MRLVFADAGVFVQLTIRAGIHVQMESLIDHRFRVRGADFKDDGRISGRLKRLI
jgi:hypothetical protein